MANSDGTYSISLSKNEGATGEQRVHTDVDTSCIWIDPNGTDHPVDPINCQTPAWFLPELPLLQASPAINWTLSLQESGSSGLHLQASYSPSAQTSHRTSSGIALDIELSSATLLPVKAKFYLHPEGQSYTEIPVDITYQDYRQVNGLTIPFRVQEFVNGMLTLDIFVAKATVK